MAVWLSPDTFVMVEGSCRTTTVAAPVTVPACAVIEVVPCPTAMTSPDEATEATLVAEEDHVTVVLSVVPELFRTVAESCWVADIQKRVSIVGETTI